MNKTQWRAFAAAREHFREIAGRLGRELPGLQGLQQDLVNRRPGPSYPVETPVVYNAALDDLGPGDEIRLILAADNPGRREQAGENRRYLVGPSGKLAEKFFRENPALGIDFRRNVLLLNKTPIHSPRTADLRELAAADPATAAAIAGSQRDMAALIAEFHRALQTAPVWITGYSEMKKGGIFEAFTETLREICRRRPALGESLFLYRHFSMNQFTIDLRRQAQGAESTADTLKRTGTAYRGRILGI
jgi:hypothetical protein